MIAAMALDILTGSLAMPLARKHPRYTPEFRRQMIELVRAGRTPEPKRGRRSNYAAYSAEVARTICHRLVEGDPAKLETVLPSDGSLLRMPAFSATVRA
jgi:hypothetical protein